MKASPAAPAAPHAAGVVYPRHAEHDLPLGLAEPLQHGGVHVLRVPREHRTEAREHLPDRLVELRLARVPLEHLHQDLVELCRAVEGNTFAAFGGAWEDAAGRS